MIIFLGLVVAQPGRLDEALALSQAHAARSRAEPGCIAHAVHRDTENSQRLVFVEQWADMDALKGLDPDDIRRAQSLPPFDMNRRPDWQARYGYYPSIAKPVIGMLNGATAGIGLVHALYCDLRFAADNTVFTTAFSRRGLIAEHGISWMLPRIVGHANALDLLMSARRVQSDEALRIGLVNRLYPPDQLREQTYAYARDLADFVSPSAIAVIKRQLYDVPFQTLAEATIDANREMVVALRGSDFREGVASFMEKRPPRFTGK